METFFQTSSYFDEIEVEELLLSRYQKGVEYVLDKEFLDGINFIDRMYKSRREEREFIQWVVQLPMMDKNTFVSFKEYQEQLSGANIDMRPDAVVDAELDEIEKIFGMDEE